VAAPGAAPASPFTSGDVCTSASAADTAGAAVYRLPAAASAFTLAGSPTIVAKLTTTGANDFVAARLYDVDGATERLIARGDVRPLGVGAGPVEQVFRLHPQAWTVQPGHVVKLELLAQDSPYLRTSSSAAPQQSVQVSDLQLRLPVVDAPGTDPGGLQVLTPAPKHVPPGYRLASGFGTNVDAGVGGTVPATLALALGGPVSLGTFVPAVAHTYTAATTAVVTSTAGIAELSATLTVSDPGHLVNGAFSLPSALQVSGVPKAYAGPVSNDAVAIGFAQPIAATDALRTGTYATTLTFTLSTTTP
jgi:hypothetical protein